MLNFASHFLCFSILLLPQQTVENQTFKSTDEQIFSEKLEIACREKTTTAAALAVAKSFVGTPYLGETLDQNDAENLVINLRGLDCWTFVENAVAIALTAQKLDADPSEWGSRAGFEKYKTELQNLRYRNGKIDGFGSRIHYFSEWFLQASEAGVLENLTEKCGGVAYKKKATYISDYPPAYPKIYLKAENLENIKSGEAKINAQKWFFIPKNKVAAAEKNIRDGDIIAFTPTYPNLDISHQGFAIRKNGRLHLLHASTNLGKVVISPRPLAEYILRNKKQTGIMVFRFNGGGKFFMTKTWW